jgi:hypothetical protein
MTITVYKVIDHLPISRDMRLRWLRSYLDSKYSRDLRAAIKTEDSEERITVIHDDFQIDREFIDDEIYRRASERLLKQAFWLRVPVPSIFISEVGKMSEDWTKTSLSDMYVLSETGIAKIRELIRVEEKWRQERRAHWVSYIAAATGFIGALTGLVALLHRK